MEGLGSLGSDLMCEMVAVNGEDETFYAEIEAPKYVDFTMPDWSRRDDRSWFCMRIGCDQAHEEVDVDALNRSFLLRVMAARSPNLKLRKALNGQAPSLIPKCPNSAPVKSPKSRITRLSTMTSVPEKYAKKKLYNHPISKLQLTPKAQSKTTSRRFLTTPRSKKSPSNLEPFRSVKHQIEASLAPKNVSVVKALYLSSTKKTEKKSTLTSRTPVSEVCAEMKRVNIGSLKKNTKVGQVCKSSLGAAHDANYEIKSSSRARKPQKKNGEPEVHKVEEGIRVNSSDMEVSVTNGCQEDSARVSTADVEVLPLLPVCVVDGPSVVDDTTKTSDKELEEKLHDKHMAADAVDKDENKENESETYSTRNENIKATESEISKAETSDNLPQEEILLPSKTFQKRLQQGSKCRKLKSTNPKPFRLRTDERGILKEASLERRLQLKAKKEITQLVNEIDSDNAVQKAKPNRAKNSCVNLVRPVDHRMGPHQCQKVKYCREKRTRSLEKKTAKVASSRQVVNISSLMPGKKVPVPNLRGKLATTTTSKAPAPNDARVGITTTRTSNSQLKNNATIPKEPTFHRLHVPRSCAKRPERACS